MTESHLAVRRIHHYSRQDGAKGSLCYQALLLWICAPALAGHRTQRLTAIAIKHDYAGTPSHIKRFSSQDGRPGLFRVVAYVLIAVGSARCVEVRQLRYRFGKIDQRLGNNAPLLVMVRRRLRRNLRSRQAEKHGSIGHFHEGRPSLGASQSSFPRRELCAAEPFRESQL